MDSNVSCADLPARLRKDGQDSDDVFFADEKTRRIAFDLRLTVDPAMQGRTVRLQKQDSGSLFASFTAPRTNRFLFSRIKNSGAKLLPDKKTIVKKYGMICEVGYAATSCS